ncbi:DDB1- and CUL4-associated factor 10 homolog [Anabrus simplex]|uniref:DDB1- and CUL4-associated factor 10 homolog n=1 Tax=Anabrus simplex TaxID=316456 RepID=UPI0035A26A71
MPKVRTRIMSDFYLRQRELGQRFPLGHADRFYRELYSSILPCTSWDHGDSLRNARHGGVFNLEFSPDGSLLVAACEKKSILMFDPLCRRLIHAVDNAHRDCVNCVRFLDSRVFATCSDDSTVALWDARNLKTQIRTLHGHSNWVKNIEFSPRDGLLVTSGFDGSIYTWDINSYTESGFVYNRVFHTNGLMRTRLNPDASKMIICTTGGYLMIVHNLDLTTLAQDLAGFKPNMYRLMQLSQTTIPLAADFTHLFSRHRTTNRVEFVADFPKGDDAEVVSSLQVHPQGWCVLSRNISNDESSEWTCVHDIQELNTSDAETEINCEVDEEHGYANRTRETGIPVDSDSDSETEENLIAQRRRVPLVQESREQNLHPTVEFRMDPSSSVRPASVSVNVSSENSSPSARYLGAGRSDNGIPVADEAVRRRGTVGPIGRLALSAANVELHVSSADVWEALVAIRDARIRRAREREREERVRERVRERVNVRIRMTANTYEDAENLRRNAEEGGRVRIVVRRNPEGNVTIVADTNREGNLHENRAGEGSSDFRTDEVSSQSFASEREQSSGSSTSHLVDNIPPTGSGLATGNISSEQDGGARHPVVIRVRNSPGPVTSNPLLQRLPRTTSAAVIPTPPCGNSAPASTLYRLNQASRSDFGPKVNRRIHRNIPRLTHYIEEPNVGKGFIKELCFSADGRLICSPFGYGVRLLGFSPECSELSVCVPSEPPVKLYEMATNVCHTDYVVSTKFSPQHCLLVSGCLSGKIVWHQPVV